MENRAICRAQVFAHIPWWYLREHLDRLLGRGVQPEIYVASEDLRGVDRGEAARVAGALREAGLGCTFHAPFLDLNPGSLDREVRLITLDRFRQLLALAALFQPRAIVFHPGYDRWRYDDQVERWLSAALDTFREVLVSAREFVPDTRILVENIYETDPGSLRDLLRGLDDPRAGTCFDCGHFFLFGQTGLNTWLETLKEYIGEIHLHDNNGNRDAHLPPGEGGFPFNRLFEFLESCGKLDTLLTLEAHSREDLEKSLAWLSRQVTIRDSL